MIHHSATSRRARSGHVISVGSAYDRSASLDARAIDSREDLAAFVLGLTEDFEANREAWENLRVGTYLSALSAWLGSADAWSKNMVRFGLCWSITQPLGLACGFADGMIGACARLTESEGRPGTDHPPPPRPADRNPPPGRHRPPTGKPTTAAGGLHSRRRMQDCGPADSHGVVRLSLHIAASCMRTSGRLGAGVVAWGPAPRSN